MASSLVSLKPISRAKRQPPLSSESKRIPNFESLFPYIRSGDIEGLRQSLLDYSEKGVYHPRINEHRMYVGPFDDYKSNPIYIEDCKTESPLLAAIVRGGAHTLEMVQLLISNGANINYINTFQPWNMPRLIAGGVLQRAVSFNQIDVVRYLLSMKCNVDQCSPALSDTLMASWALGVSPDIYSTPLMRAVEMRSIEMVQLLIASGVYSTLFY
jgi:hypothetical protein